MSKCEKLLFMEQGVIMSRINIKLPKDLEIAAYADSNPNNATSHHGELFRGLPMLLPEEFETVVYDVVYICTDYTAGNQIFQKLSIRS